MGVDEGSIDAVVEGMQPASQQSRAAPRIRMAGAAALSLTLGRIPCKLLTSGDLATYLLTGHPLRTRLGFIQIHGFRRLIKMEITGYGSPQGACPISEPLC